MRILLECLAKQNSARPSYFSSVTAYILIADVNIEQKQNSQRRQTLEIVQIYQKYSRNEIEIDQTEDDVWEESREGDNRIEIDKKQIRCTRNIVEMKQNRLDERWWVGRVKNG